MNEVARNGCLARYHPLTEIIFLFISMLNFHGFNLLRNVHRRKSFDGGSYEDLTVSPAIWKWRENSNKVHRRLLDPPCARIYRTLSSGSAPSGLALPNGRGPFL